MQNLCKRTLAWTLVLMMAIPIFFGQVQEVFANPEDIAAMSSPVNLARGLSVTSSSNWNQTNWNPINWNPPSDGSHTAATLTDGNTSGNRWAPYRHDPSPWFIINFSEPTTLDRVVMYEWRANTSTSFRTERYVVDYSVSESGDDWVRAFEGSGVGYRGIADFEPVSARRVRITITHWAGGNPEGNQPSLHQAMVFNMQDHIEMRGPRIDPSDYDMAYRRPVRARGGTGANAVNHNPQSIWSNGQGGTNWIYVDLGLLPEGQMHEFNTVFMRFFLHNRANRVRLQVSDYRGTNTSTLDNAANWVTIWDSGTPNNSRIIDFNEVQTTARYIRFYANLNSGGGGLIFFQVYDTRGIPYLRDAILNPPMRRQPIQPEVVDAQIVQPNSDGTLTFNTFNTFDINHNTLGGNIMPDFSRAGFREGFEDIPFLSDINSIRIYPSGGDDTAQINSAIQEMGSRPMDADGFRGVVHLAPGIFRITGPQGIILNRSGVVLRGSGQGMDGTVLDYFHRINTYGDFAAVGITMGINSPGLVVESGPQINVTDGFYPTGTNQLNLANASGFSVGDRIRINRTPTQAWTAFINTTSAGNWGYRQQVNNFERTITAINGNQITFEPPLMQSLNIPLEAAAFVARLNDSQRLRNIGVENLRIIANLDETTNSMNERHGTTAIYVLGAIDSFVRDVTTMHFSYAGVALGPYAFNISVLNNSVLTPVSSIDGGRRSAFPVTNGGNSLFSGNYAQYQRYEFVTGARIAGPIVFLDGIGENTQLNSGSQTHHRWASGILFDNIRLITEGRFHSIDRGSAGTGHGWPASTAVFWNVTGNYVMLGRPPTTQNFAVGMGGRFNNNPHRLQNINVNSVIQSIWNRHGGPYMESSMFTVNPSSLYRAQVSYNLTGDYRNAVPNRPVLQRPLPDAGVMQNFVISGNHERGAERVTIYINGLPAGDAAMGNESNNFEFSFIANLPPGYHKISATQTSRGIESHLVAQRSINVRNADGSHNPTRSPFVYNQATAASQNMIYLPDSELVAVIHPNEMTNLPNSSPKTAAGLGLPERIRITTREMGGTRVFNQFADVIWDVDGANYDPSNINEQTFYVIGQIVPRLNVNTMGMSLAVSIRVTVSAQTFLIGFVQFSPIAGIRNATPINDIAALLPHSAELITQDGQPAAGNIIWDLESSYPAYNPRNTESQTFYLTGNVELPPHVQAGNVSTGVRISVTVDAFRLTNLALNRPVSVSSTNGSAAIEARHLTDGNLNSRWAPLGADNNPWFYVILNEIQDINQVVLYEWFDNGNGRFRANSFSIDTSPDASGSNWRNVYMGNGIGARGEFNFDTVVAQRIRVRFHTWSTAGNQQPAIHEIEVYFASDNGIILESIIPPAPVTAIRNGTAMSVIMSYLPDYVGLVTSEGSYATGMVIWNPNSANPVYIQSYSGPQVFYLTGSVALPAYILPNGVSLEITVRIEVEGGQVNLALNRSAAASSEHQNTGIYISNLTDGTNSRWAPLGADNNPWFYVILNEIQDINQVVLYEWFDNGNGRFRANSFSIDISPDASGSNWLNVYMGNGIGARGEFNFDTVAAQRVRVRFHTWSTAGNQQPSIHRINVYYIVGTMNVQSQIPDGLEIFVENYYSPVYHEIECNLYVDDTEY